VETNGFWVSQFLKTPIIADLTFNKVFLGQHSSIPHTSTYLSPSWQLFRFARPLIITNPMPHR
jgi:hypothetical protein